MVWGPKAQPYQIVSDTHAKGAPANIGLVDSTNYYKGDPLDLQQNPAQECSETRDTRSSNALNFNLSKTSSSHLSRQGSTPPYNGHVSTLPPLPLISDELTALVFTHQTFYQGSVESKKGNDRLEFLGDAYIEVIATRLLYTLFPQLPAGRLSQRREQCVKNETLEQYATAYGFPEKVRLPPEVMSNQKLWTKTMGDIFEAYVAAVILSDPNHGFQNAEAWLTTLWKYELSRASKIETQVVDPNAKGELAKTLGGRGVKLEYKDEEAPEAIKKEGKIVYHVGVYLTGWNWTKQRLGKGEGFSKQEAGAMAAELALKDSVTQKASHVKKEYDAMVAAAREKGEAPPPFGKKVNDTGGGRSCQVTDCPCTCHK